MISFRFEPLATTAQSEEPAPASSSSWSRDGGQTIGSASTATGAVPKKAKFDEPAGSSAGARAASPPAVPDARIVGPHSACVYSLRDAARLRHAERQPGQEDSFYEVSVNDLKVLLRDLRTQARGEEDAPLLTARMRQLDESQRTLQRLARYKRTVVRVQFADQLVLQGAFSAVDCGRAVREWVRGFVREEFSGGFELCECTAAAAIPIVRSNRFRCAEMCRCIPAVTTPPKRLLLDEETLVEANCVPAAVLHFGRGSSVVETNQQILRADIAEQLSSPAAAVQEAMKYR